MDVFSRKKRSEVMSKIRAKDTKIEILFRKAIWNKGYRYRKNSNKYFGKPDVLLAKHKIVVFVDSCFWHNCPRHGYLPKSNLKYWREKLERNRRRDREVGRHYKKIGWRVLRFWEHDLKKNLDKCLQRSIEAIEFSKSNKK